MNIANKITISRVIMSFIIMILLLFPFELLNIKLPTYVFNGNIYIELKYIIAGILFVIASLTDFLDGYVARKYNMVTDFGKMVDAVSDKLLTNTVLVILACDGMVSPVIAVVIIARDIFVDSIKMVVGSKSGKAVGASIFGKLKTAFMMIGLTFMFFSNLPFELLGFSLGYYLVLIACVLSIYSGFQYFISNKKILMKEI